MNERGEDRSRSTLEARRAFLIGVVWAAALPALLRRSESRPG
jgi:hypothetical protein